MQKYIRRNSLAFSGAVFCILFSSVLAVVLQFFKGDLLDYAIAGNARETIRYALLLIGAILLEIALFFGYRQLSTAFVVGCTRALKADIFNSILRRGFTQYRAQPQGEYIAKYTNEADLIKDRQFIMLPMFCEIALKILFVSASLFVLDWRIALITLALLTTPLYVPRLIQKRLQGAQAAYVKAVEENLSKVSDWLSGFEIIKNFAIEDRIMARFQKTNDQTMDALIRDKQLGNLAQLLTTLISYLSHFAILAFAAYLVLGGAFSAGNFFVAVGLIDQLSYPLISLSGIVRQLVASRPGVQSMAAFIADAAPNAQGREPAPLRDGIRFDNVSFAYDRDSPVLTHFTLAIEKGKRYLLQGPSGCGKTTAINLLLRYHDADDGVITVDGVPLAAYDSTYGLITVVRQEAVLFHDTLRNNLTMYQDMKDETLTDLLLRLGLSKFASAQALDSVLTEDGANVSGGEKKRICLARALLRNTQVLVLDEPLANLDDATAQKIEALLLSITDRTMIVVSHQFSEDNRKAFDLVVEMQAPVDRGDRAM